LPALSPSKLTDIPNWQIQESGQPLTLLVHQLAPVNQDQGIHGSLRN
jgi:hypothetical protein